MNSNFYRIATHLIPPKGYAGRWKIGIHTLFLGGTCKTMHGRRRIAKLWINGTRIYLRVTVIKNRYEHENLTLTTDHIPWICTTWLIKQARQCKHGRGYDKVEFHWAGRIAGVSLTAVTARVAFASVRRTARVEESARTRDHLRVQLHFLHAERQWILLVETFKGSTIGFGIVRYFSRCWVWATRLDKRNGDHACCGYKGVTMNGG